MPRSKYFRHQARGEVFLLTSPFIGLGDKAGRMLSSKSLCAVGPSLRDVDCTCTDWRSGQSSCFIRCSGIRKRYTVADS